MKKRQNFFRLRRNKGGGGQLGRGGQLTRFILIQNLGFLGFSLPIISNDSTNSNRYTLPENDKVL